MTEYLGLSLMPALCRQSWQLWIHECHGHAIPLRQCLTFLLPSVQILNSSCLLFVSVLGALTWVIGVSHLKLSTQQLLVLSTLTSHHSLHQHQKEASLMKAEDRDSL